MRDLLGGGVETSLAAGLVASRATFHKGRLLGPRRGSEICLGPRQLVLVDSGVKVHVDDLVLVGEDDDGDVELVTRTGEAVVLDLRHYRRTARAWARFMANVPPQLVRDKRGALAAGAPTD